jgi:hypothetical protein
MIEQDDRKIVVDGNKHAICGFSALRVGDASMPRAKNQRKSAQIRRPSIAQMTRPESHDYIN